jgi:hypothetical protein
MKVITTREIARQTKTFFELAETERVAVKRGNKFVNLVVTDAPDSVFVSVDWFKEFMSIPAEYRCDPFEISPSGDLFFADRRNLEKISRSKTGKITRLTKEAQKALFEID